MNNLKKLPEIIHQCMTIGEIPTSYKISLTYEEQLMWFCKFLEEEVIPVVNNNSQVVQELKNFVENYFDNLDVQEEINNKLDEMVEQGTLQEIIGEYLNSKAVFGFDNIQSMKSATNLIDGSYAQTFGFYSKNDGGKALYKIREVNNTDVVDNFIIIALNNTDLVAELIIDNEINVKQAGVKGDGETDDTLLIQKVLDNFSNIYIPAGTYLIDGTISLKPKSNTNIKLDEKAILKVIPNNEQYYNCIDISNVSNVIIQGGTIQGDRDDHTGETGEWGMGISITNNSNNILIKDIIIKDCWGDGLYINTATNIETQNIICDRNRRQGLSIISVENYHSLNDRFINTVGTNPMCGVDIEPNLTTDILKNIVFDNPTTKSNWSAGISIILQQELTERISIIINNHYDFGSGLGFNIICLGTNKGNIILNNSNYNNNRYQGIVCNRFISPNMYLDINSPTINDACRDGSTTLARNYPIALIDQGEDTTTTTQNITIKDLHLYGSYPALINAYEYLHNVKNINFINPVQVPSNNTVRVKDELSLTDNYNKLVNETDSNWTLAQNSMKKRFTNKNWTANRIITLDTTIPKNCEFTFENLNSSHPIYLQLRAGLYCKQLSDNAGIGIYLRQYGSKLTLKKVDDENFVITEQIGTPTLS